MKAKPHHIKTGRVLYSVEAFPSSVPGRTTANIHMLQVTDRARAPSWYWNGWLKNLHPCLPLAPALRFSCIEKSSNPNSKWYMGRGGRFYGDCNIGQTRENSCRRVFVKLKHAKAYADRILSGCWNAQEITYVKWNDLNKSVLGHN